MSNQQGPTSMGNLYEASFVVLVASLLKITKFEPAKENAQLQKATIKFAANSVESAFHPDAATQLESMREMWNPLVDTMPMYANVCNDVDLLGLYQTTSDANKQAYRNRYKAKNRHMFVELSLLTWKYRVNVNPSLEEKYKEKVLEGWRNIPADDQCYLQVIGDENSGTAPIPTSTDQSQNMVKWLVTDTSTSPGIYLTLSSSASNTGLCSL